MSIHTTCPGCRSPFTLADAMAGKKIRCGNCQEVFVVEPTRFRRRGEEEERSPQVQEPAASVRPPGEGLRRREEMVEEDRVPPRRPRELEESSGVNNVPWIMGGIVACVLMLTMGGIIIALLLRPTTSAESGAQVRMQSPDPDPRQTTPTPAPPVQQPLPAAPPLSQPQPTTPAPTVSAAPVPEIQAPETPLRDPTRRGELGRKALARVKKATVYLRVTTPEGISSGTGFFGAPDSPSIILTNAHVVNMLAPDSRRPSKIEVFINSGERDEKKTTAIVLGVDRESDLAVLDIGNTLDAPPPLTVKASAGLQELDKVYVFGYPLGEQLGKEITIRDTSVSSLRKREGVLDKIQVSGGMDPGNSGGPVVDGHGDVVGVAVSGIPGRMINFAIPGERVQAILNGRLAELGIGQPFRLNEQVGLPVRLVMVDPRNRIKEVGLEVWTGNSPPAKTPSRPSTEEMPVPEAGDSIRQRVRLQFAGGVGQGEVKLPDLPPGKVYWIQPYWTTTSGETRWASGTVYRMTAPPLERRNVMLHSRYVTTVPRRVDLSAVQQMRVGADRETEVARLVSTAMFSETGTGNQGGVVLRLGFQSAEQKATINKKERENPYLARARENLKSLIGLVELDSRGNVRSTGVANAGKLNAHPRSKDLLEVNEAFQHLLTPLLLAMPNRKVHPLESWKISRNMVVEMVGGSRRFPLELTCTYLGVRNVSSREEAVITLGGKVRDSGSTGRAKGLVVVDVSTGTIRQVELEVDVELPLEIELEPGKRQRLRVLSLLSLKLHRSL